ncbi:hypothetical protein M5K25_025102 [Dendrobium thyrsiflorum]|uniref:Myb/SANT-like domain-containing protein n=1 Tax=Dendrobium thyrsiflorum TaxID=117978 RepID=A0ABD0U873_DENTH
MGNQKEGCALAMWVMDATLIYCDIFIREIELGNRSTTHFTKEAGLNILTNALEELMIEPVESFHRKLRARLVSAAQLFFSNGGRTYDQIQLKNKWDQLKNDYKLWKDLMRGEIEIGRNPIKKTPDASNDWLCLMRKSFVTMESHQS